MKYLQEILELTYLTKITNSPRYRRIMRVFYQESEKMHFQLYKEDIFELSKEYPEFEDYTMEQLKVDLNALVEWKNLTPIQDPKRVYTIADYKNKQFRYSMSEYAVEIERLTIKLENLFIDSGNLSANLFVRITEALEQMERVQNQPLKKINEWWRNLQEDFKRLNRNYQDYLREFYSGDSDKMLKSVEFIMHKDLFITYLKDFIQDLQIHSARIERLLKQVPESVENRVLELVVKSEVEIPRPSSEYHENLEDYISDNITGNWNSLKWWFVPEHGKTSECSQVMEVTNEVIRKIIQNAALIVQLQNWGVSRRDDYNTYTKLFFECADLEDAHKLSAHLFGIQNVRHYQVNEERSTDSINSSVYEEEPSEYLLKPHTRTYKPRIEKEGFTNKSMEKLAQRNQYLKQIEEERQMVIKYIKDNRLDIEAIEDCITQQTRTTLLRWISAANTTSTKEGQTEYGQKYKLIRKESICTLRCEDGDLRMPGYVFEFEESANG